MNVIYNERINKNQLGFYLLRQDFLENIKSKIIEKYNMNFLIETKQEYTIHLVNSIFPLIYDGLQNIYEEAKKTAKNNDELKIFQILLSNVPKWNPSIIESEYQRIIRLNNLGKTIEELLKAVIKSNIVVLTNTNVDYNQDLLKELNIQDDFKNFIHLVYIECARSFYNMPFLFSHRDSPIDIKRNQTEILKSIQECIKNAIRKMIPLQVTIKTYLENKNAQMPTDLKSESNQIKNLLKSERIKRSELTPTSPKPLNEIIGTTIHSDEYKNNNSLLKNNTKIINFSEKTLRDSILNMNQTETMPTNVFIPPAPSNKLKPKYHNNMSESSVYYGNIDDKNKKNHVIEEYSNNLGNLNILKETDDENSIEQNEKKDTKDTKDQVKPFKYFSNLNV